jgi:polyphosphate glucokinase
MKPRFTRSATLCFDIGGTFTKAQLFSASGVALSERIRLPTPRQASPRALLQLMEKLAEKIGDFSRISAGFPGVTKKGITCSAAHLGRGWGGFDLVEALRKKFRVPVRVANDADVQGLGAVSGSGVELVITFGTGVGSALFTDGILVPNLELGHQIFLPDGSTYEDKLGKAAIEKEGRREWRCWVLRAIPLTHALFNWDWLYLGGGNAKHIRGPFPKAVSVVSNEDGLRGGVKLWAPPDFGEKAA